MIGYPYLFPERNALIWNVTDCQTILRRFDQAERKAVRNIQYQLNQLLNDAAAEAGIEFISPTNGWDGHEPCGTTGEQYTNSIKPFLVTPVTGFDLGDGGSFHPTDAGQREIARLVTCYLVEHRTPRTIEVGSVPLGTTKNPLPECLPEPD